jgi:hypothetical protein
MKIDVLDKGYIEVVDTLGDDLTPVNAARVSFDGFSETFTDKDRKLSKFLIKHKHHSPFRHQHVMFIIKAPEFVMRQWYKHVVGIEPKTTLGMRLVVVMFLMMSSTNLQSFVNNQKITNKRVMD